MNPKSTRLPNTTILIGALIASFILAYLPVWKNLLLCWSQSDDYSYGFFIIPVCIYIIWHKRRILAKIEISPSNWGIVIVAASLLLYVIAYFAEIATVVSLSIIPLLSGIIIYLYGFAMFKELLFPVLFLSFMIPIPAQIYSSLTIPLQLFVSQISVEIASLLGIPVYREGNVIHLPDITLQVVQACSGLRSLMSLLCLSAVFGYFMLKRNLLRGILFLSAIPAAILVNIFRVLVINIAFYYFGYDLTTGAMHTILGVVIFAFALAIIGIAKGVLSIWDASAIREH